MWLTLILFAIMFGSLASMLAGGLWGNVLIFINAVTAALLATNYWEPLANWLNAKSNTYTFLWDFMAQWGIFVLAMVVFRALTDVLSKVKVRFKKPVELAGGIFFALLTGWVLVCFTTFTLHTAPLAQTPLGGEFAPKPETRMFVGMGPDRRWLAFVNMLSRGAFQRGGTAEKPNLHEFDPEADYMFKYAQRRKQFEKTPELRVRPGEIR
jgi:hypothetical protein